MCVGGHLWAWRSYLVFFLAPVVLSPLVVSIGSQESKCAYVLMLMAAYWISGCLPVGVSALLPVVFFPFFQIMSTTDTAKEYMNSTVMLTIGGLTTALAIEYWNVHKRVALRILTFVGSEPRWLMLGLMLSTWFMSMWISNTASTAMMVPITEAILQEIRDTDPVLECEDKDTDLVCNAGDEKSDGNEYHITGNQAGNVQEKQDNGASLIMVPIPKSRKSTDCHDKDLQTRLTSRPTRSSLHRVDPHYDNMAKGMFLSICYAANCGGTASLTGTGSNLVLKKEVDEIYESNGLVSPITFSRWLLFGVPMSMAMVTTVWICLQLIFLRCRYGQVLACVLFVIMVVLWLTYDMGGAVGWGREFEIPVKGGSVAVLMCVLTFGLPSTLPFLKSYPNTYHPETESVPTGVGADNPRVRTDYIEIRPLLQWNFAVKRFPWSLLLLMGGGYCLSSGCKVSGLSAWIGHELTRFEDWNQYAILFIICYFSSLATEFASNSAMTSILMPILLRLALSTKIHPLKYMLSACFSCSFAYMLPVATPPNAIVFSTGKLTIKDMMKAGFVMNLLAVPLLVFLINSLGNAIYDLGDIPHQFLNTTLIS